jgi:hypothetical protein
MTIRSKLALAAAVALVLVPAASSQGGPPYADASGDSSSAGDLNGLTVVGDKASGQIIFRISGTNLSTSPSMLTLLFIDSDANPATGNQGWAGADYVFAVDDSTYDFEHWNGSDWVGTPYSTVRVTGGGSNVMISVNRSELGNTPEFNFTARTVNTDTDATDDAPELGMFNYSLDAGGPDIQSVMLQTRPSSGPKAGKPFVIEPLGLKLPPDGAPISVLPHPDTYSCRATIGGHAVVGKGVGGCTLRIAKNTRGKSLRVMVTVTYEGATKSVPYTFAVS